MSKDNASIWLRLAELEIMILAHDPWIRDSLVKYFKSNGCEAVAFDSGKRAQEALAEKPFDIIIADSVLPDMTGFEFFRQSQTSGSQSINILIWPGDSEKIPSGAGDMEIRIIEKPLKTNAIDDAFQKVIKE